LAGLGRARLSCARRRSGVLCRRGKGRQSKGDCGQTCGYEDLDAPAQLIRSTHISLPASDCCSFRRAEHAQGEPAHRQDCGRTGRNRSAQMPTPSNSPRLKLSHESERPELSPYRPELFLFPSNRRGRKREQQNIERLGTFS
jgi:hypothetical protein